jgi:hypothetical protein
MAIFDVNALDAGLVNTLPAGLPASVVTTAANSTGTITGTKVTIAGAMEDIEYVVVSPPFQINGSTVASGSYVLTMNYYQDDGTTLVDANAFPSQACSATVNGATVGTEVPYRTALPYGATKAQPVIVVTGNCGQITAGWALGGKAKNRAG